MGDGISGLIGAAIGGLLTFAGAFWTGRNQGRTQHEQWLRQVRRDAYAQFIIQTEKAHQLGHEADDSVRNEEAGAAERIEELARAAYRVREAATLVALEGPQQIALDASNIQIRVDEWVIALRMICEGRADDATWERAVRLPDRVEDGLSSFTDTCQALLDS
ncbi:hypothetical protein ACFV47_16490 [Streptomyces solisilvae]|uniref:hypothetical protein n=1 Tax=Streptomyces malaysiensis TaxID=92644 RepID=UPI0036C975EA